MFDVDDYLAALGHHGSVGVDRETLRRLHHAHLRTVPYDSELNTARGTDLWKGVDIDDDAVFDAVIRRGRGGVCYELNGLFRRLLTDLGYETGVFAAGIRQVDGSFGPDLEHIFSFVRLDGELLLVDVGFVGPSYLEPLRLGPEEQHQFGTTFRIVAGADHHVLQRRGSRGEWAAVYRFRPVARELAAWAQPSEELAAFARALAGAGTLVRGRATAGGQRILIGKRLVTVEDGQESMRVLTDPAEHARVLAEILGRGAGPEPVPSGGAR
ncbi:acetyltransferase [Parafrankia colletiae]|uniref:Acetyltransferase n=1 Tax=Parafrankia colletiae TaxID=573497 RepID=A0A1S1QHF0_9ACTN|nr:arylamine N-acetyltransferase [Parafrankia colletiae]MCK9901915.1 arylamine N-acetyltransferase [Frankia sp. Cpl3]OHV32871.1 acetyltransferase [Parafrankia colletiae]